MPTKNKNSKGTVVNLSQKLLGRKPSARATLLVAAVVVAVVAVAGAKSYSGAHASTYCVESTLGSGSSGACVRDLQIVLNNWNAHSGNGKTKLVTDGSYGYYTQSMVKNFQNWSDHIANSQTGSTFPLLTVDGVAGPHTWKALCYWASWMSYDYDGAGCYAVYGYKNG